MIPRKAVGRAELQVLEKGGLASESEVLDRNHGVSEEVEVDGRAAERGYRLRPEELDAEGRHVEELHGDGRQVGGLSCRGLRRCGDIAFVASIWAIICFFVVTNSYEAGRSVNALPPGKQ
jgi:hypothetical protein